jgi:hypothetical protein
MLSSERSTLDGRGSGSCCTVTSPHSTLRTSETDLMPDLPTVAFQDEWTWDLPTILTESGMMSETPGQRPVLILREVETQTGVELVDGNVQATVAAKDAGSQVGPVLYSGPEPPPGGLSYGRIVEEVYAAMNNTPGEICYRMMGQTDLVLGPSERQRLMTIITSAALGMRRLARGLLDSWNRGPPSTEERRVRAETCIAIVEDAGSIPIPGIVEELVLEEGQLLEEADGWSDSNEFGPEEDFCE